MVYEYFHRDFQQAQTQNDTWQLTRKILYHLGIQEKNNQCAQRSGRKMLERKSLENLGYTIKHFMNNEIVESPDDVINVIKGHLQLLKSKPKKEKVKWVSIRK
jgi:glucosamine 6-phosphate synthetase-like amidotransferase/phosphosugar isomerase protein